MGAGALAQPLALLEVVDRDGLVRQAWRIEHWPVSIGRALDNTVVLSDPHVAAHHATLDLVDGVDGAPPRSSSAPARRGTASASAASASPAAAAPQSPTADATSISTSVAPSCACACPAMRSAPSRR